MVPNRSKVIIELRSARIEQTSIERRLIDGRSNLFSEVCLKPFESIIYKHLRDINCLAILKTLVLIAMHGPFFLTAKKVIT